MRRFKKIITIIKKKQDFLVLYLALHNAMIIKIGDFIELEPKNCWILDVVQINKEKVLKKPSLHEIGGNFNGKGCQSNSLLSMHQKQTLLKFFYAFDKTIKLLLTSVQISLFLMVLKELWWTQIHYIWLFIGINLEESLVFQIFVEQYFKFVAFVMRDFAHCWTTTNN